MDEKMEKVLVKFTDTISGIFGARLKSLVLYGSQASGEASKKHSDYNLLLVLDELKHADLKVLGSISSKWLKKNPPPLVFTREMFFKSTDVFPMEFLDMKDNHRILAGEDLFNDMRIDLNNLKHECEFELKGKLLKLRQGYLAAAGKSGEIRRLMINSISSFLVIFRNVVRLTGQTPSLRKIEALNMLASTAKIDPAPFLNVHKMKDGDRPALKLNPEELFIAYLKEVEKTVEFVDNLS